MPGPAIELNDKLPTLRMYQTGPPPKTNQELVWDTDRRSYLKKKIVIVAPKLNVLSDF